MASVRETAFIILKGLYEQSNGDCQTIVSPMAIIDALGLDRASARGALGYLNQRGLIHDINEVAEIPHTRITSSGIDAVEDAMAHPAISTQHFPAVQNIINIQTFNGGAIQQGTNHSVQNVGHAGHISGMDLPKLAAELAALREAVLPQASSPEHFAALGRLAEAQLAAQEKNTSKVQHSLSSIGTSGRWLVSIAEKIGVGLATATLKSSLGL